jgi:hypothetical protein
MPQYFNCKRNINIQYIFFPYKYTIMTTSLITQFTSSLVLCYSLSTSHLCSNLQKVLDKVRSVTSQGQQKTLRPVVAQNTPRTHRVLEHKSQLGMADAQREECSKCPVEVRPVRPLAQSPCTHPYKLQEGFFLTCSLRSTPPTQQ